MYGYRNRKQCNLISLINLKKLVKQIDTDTQTNSKMISQPLTEMSTRSRKIMFLGSRARPMLRVDNLTPPVSRLSYNVGPQHLTPLKASTAYYEDSFTFYFTKPLFVSSK
jgi:hypothetical protein